MEVFWPLGQYVLKLSAANEAAVADFTARNFWTHNIGMQIRGRHRHSANWGEEIPLHSYCSLARLLQQQSGPDSTMILPFLLPATTHKSFLIWRSAWARRSFFRGTGKCYPRHENIVSLWWCRCYFYFNIWHRRRGLGGLTSKALSYDLLWSS